jgi:ABC-type branched-subunit amino acid transport system ATPase component
VLLVLDEPTVGVDPQSRNAILEIVEALSSGANTASLASTEPFTELLVDQETAHSLRFAVRSGVGVEPTQPWAARPHRF